MYESVASSLTQVFGVGNKFGNLIYNKPVNAATTLNDIRNNRVVIIVQPYDVIKLTSSSMNNITAYILNSDGYTRPCINRIKDTMSNLSSDPNLHFLYPDLIKQSNNFNPKNSFSQNITFIAMNFQKNDLNLKKYSTKFHNTSIILQTS